MKVMINYGLICLLCCAMLLMTSCEKVIHVNINGVNKKYVIEGTVTDAEDSYNVLLSQTLDVEAPNVFNGVENAHVTIAEDGKTPIALEPKGNGLYTAKASGKPGSTYDLTVKIGKLVFTARSKMPQKVPFDSLYSTSRVFLGKERKTATLEFKDPAGKGNAYRFIQFVDGRKENTIFILNDQLIDGRSAVHELVIFDNESGLKTNDDLRVEMHCISMESYDYWYSLTQSSLGQSQSASPGNPLTNIKGGAIGYFSAHTFDAKETVVK